MVIGKIATQEFLLQRLTRKILQGNSPIMIVMFLQGDPDSDFGEPIWLGRIVPNIVNHEFQKQTIWEADKLINLYGISLDCVDIGFKIQQYEQVPGIFESYLVHRFYCGQLPQIQSHTQLVHGNIEMYQVSGRRQKYKPARHKSQLLAENQNRIKCKLNGGNDFYDKLAKEVVI